MLLCPATAANTSGQQPGQKGGARRSFLDPSRPRQTRSFVPACCSPSWPARSLSWLRSIRLSTPSHGFRDPTSYGAMSRLLIRTIQHGPFSRSSSSYLSCAHGCRVAPLATEAEKHSSNSKKRCARALVDSPAPRPVGSARCPPPPPVFLGADIPEWFTGNRGDCD
jgi:hypothetical protein